jgi:ubiquinone/menaquinone biosynthesis C-methylase UbiE
MKQEFYQALHDALQYSDPHEVFYAEYLAKEIHRLLAPHLTPSSTVLDIGSGDGLLTRLVQILCQTHHGYGVDIDNEAVLFAQELYPSITFMPCQPLALPFPDHFFDAVYQHSVLHHIPHDQHARYAAEINRIVKPGGTVIVLELNPYNRAVRNNFKKNPTEHGLSLLASAYTKQLLEPYGIATLEYCWTVRLGFLQPLLRRIPLGAVYALCLRTRLR